MSRFASTVLERILKRPVRLDPDISTWYVLGRATTLSSGLLRGLLFVRKRIVLGPRSSVREPRKLFLSGGLPRIEESCVVDCVSRDGIHFGRNVKIAAFSRLIASGTLSDLGIGIRIGDNVGVGEFAYIGGAGGVTIGADTIIGQYFSVHPENHVFDDPDVPIREQGVTRAGIEIGSGCWIGAKVTIIDGVKIGRNCVVAAGCVVTKSFPDHSLIGGVPGKLLKTIGPNDPDQTGG